MKRQKAHTFMDQHASDGVQRVALFVDFDNAWFGLQGTGIKGATTKTIARSLLELARRLGSVAASKVYSSEPRRIPGMRETFTRQGYEVVAAENPRKNTDIQMAFDGQEILFTRPEIDTFILVSGDSDFAPLARAIRQQGKRLIVVASRAVLSRALTEQADIFISLEDCLSGAGISSSFLEMREPTNRRGSIQRSEPKDHPLSALPILRVFLCHSRHDRARVRDLYVSLRQQPGIQPWLDREDLLPGQDWELEITKAVRASHSVICCLSKRAIDSAGYVHKEIRFALDIADQQPEGTVFLIPLKFEECEVPERLRRFHWVDLFEPTGYEFLLRALRARAESLS
jgi:uncharacterized protein (TIGR00288 family)